MMSCWTLYCASSCTVKPEENETFAAELDIGALIRKALRTKISVKPARFHMELLFTTYSTNLRRHGPK